nr:substrate-binding domain-containing protein [uncultured Cohaesibacter sp.]
MSTALMINAASALTIGATMSNSKDPFLQIVTNSIKSAAQNASGVSLDLVSAESDGATQVEQVKSFIERGVDAVIINQVADEGAEELQALAADAKIPLVYVNRQPAQSRFPGPVSIVSCNEIVAGRLQMRYMADKAGGAGNVVILNGELSHPAAKARTAGVKEVMQQYPGLTIVHEQTANWSRDDAEKLVTGLLEKGMKIDIIAANNDEMAIGAIRAYQKLGKDLDSVVIGGVDATPDALAEVDAGNLEVSILQNAAAQGQQSIKNAVAMAGGGYAQEFDWVPWEMVIPSNLSKYK